jgi:hypothetical protein
MIQFRLSATSLVLTLYRLVGLSILYGILGGMVSYGAVIIYYLTASSWGAPVTLSASDAASLDMLGKVLTSNAQRDALAIDTARLTNLILEMKIHRLALQTVADKTDPAIAREDQAIKESGRALASLDQQKQSDIDTTDDSSVAALRSEIDTDMTTGLMTKSDAETAKLALTQARNGFTDNRITEILLRDQIVEHNPTNTKMLETLTKRAELLDEISQLNITICASSATLKAETDQIRALDNALQTAQDSPVYAVLSGPSKTFLFVPYGTAVQPNAPLYSCKIGIVACSKAGRIVRLFPAEVHGANPLFKDDVRGTLAEISLYNPEDGKAKVLFFGRPLWIF